MSFHDVDEVVVDPDRARVYEHGWQSWSPSTWYPVTGTPLRAVGARNHVMGYRPERPAPSGVFQGEGLLAVDPGDGTPVRVYSAGGADVPSIRAALSGTRLAVSADSDVLMGYHSAGRPPRTGDAVAEGGHDAGTAALAAWATGYAARLGVPAPRPAPTAWCSWYHYYTRVTAADMTENLAGIGARGLPVDVVQLDDGWQSAVGDWLTYSDRFPSLAGTVGGIRDAGRRAGIWVAPFTVSADSETARAHPDWLLRGADGAPADAGHNWGGPLYGLDLTHPGVRDYLTGTFTRLAGMGVDYFKIDFLYAGALEAPRHDDSHPLAAYRSGLALIRRAVGPEAYLLGCGAPILPSVGLVDAMRVGADVAPVYRPDGGDASQPSQWSATVSTVGRAWQHGRFWVNDPDCLIARPAVQRRERWARVVEAYGGLRSCSDRIAELDEWGLETTRRVLAEVPPPTPFALGAPVPAVDVG